MGPQCLEYDGAVQMTLVDLPEQIGVARSNLRDHQERVAFCEVDVLDASVPFPAAQDAIWMSQFLSCFSAETMLGILRRAATSLSPGGRVFVLDTFSWDRQRFDIAAYCIINTSPYFTAIANGREQDVPLAGIHRFGGARGLATGRPPGRHRVEPQSARVRARVMRTTPRTRVT